ncbi:hypothetical protein BPAE_0113g00120 [Botrytis paeoniae]|uniref:Uncharacterized protein n=1 Tax=Botrytis paeoniae TaxID=278948 RepID=A0A4Z1FHV5_9HELO|nr:hypothetical protein BPAE_0113g00120 [Botrytis paeoniae]
MKSSCIPFQEIPRGWHQSSRMHSFTTSLGYSDNFGDHKVSDSKFGDERANGRHGTAFKIARDVTTCSAIGPLVARHIENGDSSQDTLSPFTDSCSREVVIILIGVSPHFEQAVLSRKTFSAKIKKNMKEEWHSQITLAFLLTLLPIANKLKIAAC